MFFTRFGRVVAYLALVIGIVHIALGLVVAMGYLDPEVAQRRYGASIDKGAYAVVFSIVLGVFTEIRLALGTSAPQ